MPFEIERKFLVTSNGWQGGSKVKGLIQQGFIKTANHTVVRIRTMGEQAWLTIKGEPPADNPTTRAEFEYPIPHADAQTMLSTLCNGGMVEKVRHLADYGGHTWEIDVFAGKNEGLVLAEVELPAADTAVRLPPWAGPEVSTNHAYTNAALAQVPYTSWPDDQKGF